MHRPGDSGNIVIFMDEIFFPYSLPPLGLSTFTNYGRTFFGSTPCPPLALGLPVPA